MFNQELVSIPIDVSVPECPASKPNVLLGALFGLLAKQTLVYVMEWESEWKNNAIRYVLREIELFMCHVRMCMRLYLRGRAQACLPLLLYIHFLLLMT